MSLSPYKATERSGVMVENKSIAVIVPACRVAGQISEVLSLMPDYIDRIYVVDDA
jgi:dolichol-phosphate mannosyltransferase